MIGRVRRAILLVILLILLICPAAPALASGQSQPAASPADTASQQGAATTPQQPEPAQRQVKAYTLPPDKYEKAVAYSRARYRLYFIEFVYGVILLLLVLRWWLAPKYRDWAERATGHRFLQAVIYTPLLLLTVGILGLPVDIYSQWLERKYDISVQGWGSWAWDWTKGELIAFAIGIILLWILYAVIRHSERRWWFYFWLASLPILLFVFFISPLVIDPLFYKFEPLERTEPGLVATLEQVVHRGGMNIPPERMFLMKASEKTKAVNAYVTGFGASKRVVVWDTTIQNMATPEVVFTFGHEMGHYVLGHIWKGLLFFAGLFFVLLYLGHRFIHWTLQRWGAGWGIRGLNDWASLPALLLLISIFSFLFDPISNTFSRYIEHQADVYGLEVTHGITPNSGQVAAGSFQILGEVDLSDPHPSEFIRIWLYNHPPIGERVAFALSYDPWSKGQPPEFVK
jgi:Zn-dependent protease with chaperone function